MENELFGIDVTSEFILITAPKNEDEAKRLHGWRMDGIDGYASFNLDREGRVVYWSPSAARMTGHTPEEITGQHFSCLYEGRETLLHKTPKYFLGIAVKQGLHEYQGWWLRRDASHFWARVMIMSMDNTGGDFAVMVWDMSKNRRALAEMSGRHKPSPLDD